MKSGTNCIILAKLNVNVADVDSILFTFAGKKKVVKRYPDEVGYTESSGVFSIPFYQEDTMQMQGSVLCEAQINYLDGAVIKTEVSRLYITSTVGTELIEGDTPSGRDVKEIQFEVVGNAVIARIEGEVDPADIERAVEEYLDEHPIAVPTKVSELENDADYVTKSYVDGKALPSFTEADNGKVLGIVNGQLAWVEGGSPAPVVKVLESILSTKGKTTYNVNDYLNTDDIVVTAFYDDGTSNLVNGWTSNADMIDMSVDGNKDLIVSYSENGVTKTDSILIVVENVQPVPPEPIVPQSGTWQLKTTPQKKYVIIGTDDDNYGNPKFLRLLRTFNFPYVSNTEAESVEKNKSLGSDVDDNFLTTDAPSLFPNDTKIIDFLKYVNDNNLGEVAQHGASSHTLWDSNKLSGTFWTNLYADYTSQGGTKTEDELREAIKEQLADCDVQQGAVYVENSRTKLESILGFPIATVGIWGGSPSATVDGIELSLNSIKGGDYGWREHNYWGISPYLDFRINSDCYHIARVGGSPKTVDNYLDNIYYGKAIEFFWHMPFNDNPFADYRALFERLSANPEVEVVTRYEYCMLGEFVENPIKSISVVRNGSLNVGDTDTDSAYTVTVTYADGTSGQPSADMILDRSKVNTSTSGTYVVNVYYRGFTASCNAVVMSSMTFPEGFKDTGHWFVLTSGGKYFIGNSTLAFLSGYNNSAEILVFKTNGNGTINGWKSDDDGETWTQVTTNKQTFNGLIPTNTASDTDGKYGFNFNWKTKVTLVDNSDNMVWNYPYN